MISYILQRIALAIPVLLIVGIIVFALVHLTPGDPASVMLGPDATSEQVDDLRDAMGLNDPLPIQFANWVRGIVQLDFGESFFLRMPVTEALVDRLEVTMLLTLYSLVFAVIIGIPLGVIAAVKANSPVDRFLMIVSLSGAAIPNFVLGILLILVFAVILGWLPSGRYVEIREDPVAHMQSMILPSIALGFSSAALIARIVRSSMLDVLREDYIRTAYSKGLMKRHVVIRHALRNVLIPTITIIGLSLGALLGGAVVTETVFTLPGMGRLVVQSVARRDYPVIQGAVMLIAVFYVLANLLVDVLYIYLDPRIGYGRK